MKKSKVLNIISNVCFVIVMILLVTFMIYGFGNLAKNKVPSFFGQSYVRILSNSMNDNEYKNGELNYYFKFFIFHLKPVAIRWNIYIK